MKSFRQIVSEVAEPKAGDEKTFKAKHIVTKVDYPVDVDDQFTGGKTSKKAPKRKADHEAGEDTAVYEAADTQMGTITVTTDAQRKARAQAYRDKKEAPTKIKLRGFGPDHKKSNMSNPVARGALMNKEAMDPVNKKALSKKFKDRQDQDIDNDGDVDDSDRYLHARRKAISKAIKQEEAELEESITKMSHGRLKFHMNTGTPHGSYTKDEMKAERDRRLKTGEGEAYKKAKASMSEEVEQIDELSPNTLHSYIKGASKDLAKRSRMSGYDDKRGNYADGDKNRKRANKRMAGIASASGRLADKANMAENAWEEVPMMMRQLQFICYAAEEIMEYLDMGVDPEEWYQNKLAHVHDQMQTLHAYAEGDKRQMSKMDFRMYGEETEELDESQRSLDAHKIKQAAKVKAGIPLRRPGESLAAYVTRKAKAQAKMQKEEVELDEATPSKKAITRALQGMKVQPKDKVSVKKAPWEKNEDLDEVTQSAIKKPVTTTGPDGKTRTVYKSIKSVDRDEHGQEKIKESVLDEAFKTGIVKLKDGGSVILKKEDADLLNQMFKDLSSTNRKKMQEVAMKDKAGFEEILGFAKEAL